MQLDIPFHLENFIGGNFIGPLSAQFIDNVNPATGEVFCRVPDSNEKDIAVAYNAAQQAFDSWSSTSPEKRFEILNRIADLIDENREVLAMAETNDNGKPLWLSKKTDIPRASANFRFFATGIMHFATESHSSGQVINYTLRQPLGVVGCISPWNLPLYLFTWKIAPALAAGNCVIAKPSEVTPVSAFLLGKI
ncbi:MAG TPA: aldehyde dehydrogenase family protein, partial [Ferruginibacter sp.]|nr:aldehyde dehydrogenase family protein [Ferruginibacter sp.]